MIEIKAPKIRQGKREECAVHEAFSWRGKPISDIEKWSEERAEKMVDIIWEIKETNPFSGQIMLREEKQSIPQSFFEVMCYGDQKIVKNYKYRNPK